MCRSKRLPRSLSEALDWLARVYRKDLWTDADCAVQVWLEKDALTGVLSPVTHKYGAHRGAAYRAVARGGRRETADTSE